MMIRSIILSLFLFWQAPAWSAAPLDINSANAVQLAETLVGVGPQRAAAIVAWREAHGPFRRVEDLARVKGIGAATVERNRGRMEVADRDEERALLE